MKSRKAFTLIESLIIAGIAAILLGLLVPNPYKAQAQSYDDVFDVEPSVRP